MSPSRLDLGHASAMAIHVFAHQVSANVAVERLHWVIELPLGVLHMLAGAAAILAVWASAVDCLAVLNSDTVLFGDVGETCDYHGV